MQAQEALLRQRYNLEPKLDPEAKMARGKALVVGPTARLQSGLTWDELAQMRPDEIRAQGVFPYPALPHPLQVNGGQVFPRMQLQMFPRLQRFDVEFDLPEAFLPELPPAIFLSNRPELGDVSRGEVISINNYYRLFKGLLTPVQLDGLRLLLTPFPQEEFNPTDDRKTVEPSLGVTCLDCHINGHTTGQFHLTPDIRPQERRCGEREREILRLRYGLWGGREHTFAEIGRRLSITYERVRQLEAKALAKLRGTHGRAAWSRGPCFVGRCGREPPPPRRTWAACAVES
jgi:DNA-binding CsgD family transcriptional regulator